MPRHSAAAPVAPSEAAPPFDFAGVLLTWQRTAGRHDLPWQNTTDPYRIWLSEIMLQQTQVAAVIPYYSRFLERFPDIASLAAAPADAVMALWSGLGYYSRARNLHACAKAVVAEHGGVFPDDPDVIATLPGIGRSTAAAIAAFAYRRRAAILDGNVKRVLCRIFGIAGFPGERAVEQRLWALAATLLPADAADMIDYTQGVMDLGATVCKPRNPACEGCVMRAYCVAFASGRTAELPTARPRKAMPQRATMMVVLRHAGRVLLEKRPPLGIWGGLWSLPQLPLADAAAPGATRVDAAALRAFVAQHGTIDQISLAEPFSHGFTHFHLTVQPVVVDLAQRHAVVGDAARESSWLDNHGLAGAGLPAPVRKFLERLPGQTVQASLFQGVG